MRIWSSFIWSEANFFFFVSFSYGERRWNVRSLTNTLLLRIDPSSFPCAILLVLQRERDLMQQQQHDSIERELMRARAKTGFTWCETRRPSIRLCCCCVSFPNSMVFVFLFLSRLPRLLPSPSRGSACAVRVSKSKRGRRWMSGRVNRDEVLFCSGGWVGREGRRVMGVCLALPPLYFSAQAKREGGEETPPFACRQSSSKDQWQVSAGERR